MRNWVLAGVAAFALAACGSSEGDSTDGGETATASATGSADGKTSTTTIKADGGTATIQSGPGAAVDLPLGFRIYPGAEVLTSTTFAQNGDKGALVTMLADAKPDEMIAFYRKAAEAAGVKIEMELTTDNSKIIGGKGGDDVTFSFTTVPGDDGKTQGQLMIGSGG
ncbi:MAG: hypothetical protein R3D99_05310 [Altererythrobacter sp.]